MLGNILDIELGLRLGLLLDLAACHLAHRLTSLVSLKLLFKLCVCLLLHIEFHYFIFVDLLMNKLLSISARKFVL